MAKSVMYDTVKNLYEKYGEDENILIKAVARMWITEEEKARIMGS